MSAKPIKRAKTTERDTLRPEYRREDLGVGVRGKYLKQHTQDTNLVLLQPDVAKVFHTQEAVNEALRGLIQDAEREDYEPYIVIEVPSRELAAEILNESEWRKSEYKDFWYRVDPENPAISQQRHVHIAHKKHISAPGRQVAWNQDHSRHDAHKFNPSFIGLVKAKDLARQVLGLPPDALLEYKIPSKTKAGKLLEEIETISKEPALPSDSIRLLLQPA